MPTASSEIVPLSEKDKVRFWSKVDKAGPIMVPKLGCCWRWIPGGNPQYGKIRIGAQKVLAHRVSFYLATGLPTGGVVVRHKCDNPTCVNPQHLLPGSQLDNIADRQLRGRQAKGDRSGSRTHPERRPRGDNHPSRLHPEWWARGETNGSAKLTECIVREMRQLHELGAGSRALGRRFKVTHSTVMHAVNGSSWRHVK